VITLAPGECRPFDAADLVDALVVLQCGEVDLEATSGCRERLGPGAIFWLAGLPLQALHNAGPVPAVLVAIRRVPPRFCGPEAR
jgi:hypothetical protein